MNSRRLMVCAPLCWAIGSTPACGGLGSPFEILARPARRAAVGFGVEGVSIPHRTCPSRWGPVGSLEPGPILPSGWLGQNPPQNAPRLQFGLQSHRGMSGARCARGSLCSATRPSPPQSPAAPCHFHATTPSGCVGAAHPEASIAARFSRRTSALPRGVFSIMPSCPTPRRVGLRPVKT
jgi:hypothetical protein